MSASCTFWFSCGECNRSLKFAMTIHIKRNLRKCNVAWCPFFLTQHGDRKFLSGKRRWSAKSNEFWKKKKRCTVQSWCIHDKNREIVCDFIVKYTRKHNSRLFSKRKALFAHSTLSVTKTFVHALKTLFVICHNFCKCVVPYKKKYSIVNRRKQFCLANFLKEKYTTKIIEKWKKFSFLTDFLLFLICYFILFLLANVLQKTLKNHPNILMMQRVLWINFSF